MIVRSSPLFRSTFLFLTLVALVTLGLFLLLSYREALPSLLRKVPAAPIHAPSLPQQPVSTVRVPCEGPRGKLLDASPDDQVQAKVLDIPFPEPAGGSYEALNLPKTWNTPRTRYGAYGLGEDREDYNRSRVEWENVDWAALQNECLTRNQNRFRYPTRISTTTRFHLYDEDWDPLEPLEARSYSTGRTAIVLRGYEGHDYIPADLYHIRSLIVEAGLSSNADYAIYLLVDVKDKDRTRRILHDPKSYNRALEELVPKELRSIAVLFDHELLESYYPDVPEHSVFFQVYQPLQLFAQLFTGFDHYWQFELDSKITGDSRQFLDAISTFARNESQTQSVERSSYYYMPAIHGTYEEFRSAVNASLNGTVGMSTPISISSIPQPLDPFPLVSPTADPPTTPDFSWNTHRDADLILTNAFANVLTTTYWPFDSWLHNLPPETPRFYSPVAMGRYSYNLLNAIHHSQHHSGLALPSEATPISFALYHNLKIIFPPIPWFHHPQSPDTPLPVADLNTLFNGGTPAENSRKDNAGLSFGKALYDPRGVYEQINGGTWWWVPGFPGRIVKMWWSSPPPPQQQSQSNYEQELEAKLDSSMPLGVFDGQIWAPTMALHPVKRGDFEI